MVFSPFHHPHIHITEERNGYTSNKRRRLPNMTKVIAFANQKGGGAKTTSAVALAQSLAMEGKRILFLDLDPQENASNTLRVNNTPTLYDLMKARIRTTGRKPVLSTSGFRCTSRTALAISTG